MAKRKGRTRSSRRNNANGGSSATSASTSSADSPNVSVVGVSDPELQEELTAAPSEVVPSESSNVRQGGWAPKKAVDHKYRSFTVTTNSVSITRRGNPITIYKYDMKFFYVHDERRSKAELNKEEVAYLMKGLMQVPEAYETMKGVFWCDFKSLFYSRYSIEDTTYKLQLEGEDMELVIHPTEVITLTGMEEADERVIQAVSNAVMYETFVEKDTFCLPGKIFYGKTFQIDKLIQGRLGINYAFRNTEKGVLMELDQCASSFVVSGPLMNVVRMIAGGNMNAQFRVNEKSLQDVSNALKGVKMYTSYQGYKHRYTFKRLLNESANEKMIEIDGEPTSVANFMKDKYDITLRYPQASLVEMSKKGCFIPMELLTVSPNQRYQKLLSPEQLSTMIRTTASLPSKRLALVDNFVSTEQSQFRLLKELDITLDKTPQRVKGYQLPVPFQKGDSKKKFVERSLTNYVSIVLDRKNGPTVLPKLFTALSKVMSMKVRTRYITCDIGNIERAVEMEINELRATPQLIFFFLPPHAASIYKEAKRVSDVVFKVPSQCVACETLARGVKPSYVQNLSLKINAKLGGVNAVLAEPLCDRYTMVCGADVTHPMRGEKDISIASIVGTFDQYFAQYASESSVQRGRMEIIEDMQSMMAALFDAFYRRNNHVPESVVFFRDGVGDSMFSHVLHKEVPKIYLAFRSCFPEWPQPLRLTFLICQKRHNMKLFPSEKDKNGNARSGLLVDEGIVSKEKSEFYLQSANTLAGTGRSCRYTVLVDDNEYPLEKLELLTYNSCFLFNRCTTPIGICAPARYAHHLCFRTRDILRVSDGNDARSVGSNSSAISASEGFKYDSSMKEKMFYI